MITDKVSPIKREVLQLIDLQIETLKQRSSLDSFQLKDYQARFFRKWSISASPLICLPKLLLGTCVKTSPPAKSVSASNMHSVDSLYNFPSCQDSKENAL